MSEGPRIDRSWRLPVGPLVRGAVGLLSASSALSAQEVPPPSLRAGSLGEDDIRLDGLVDEARWLTADSISDLVMIDPTEGARPTGRTSVRVLVDAEYILVGIVAYDPDPAGIVSFSKARDANIFSSERSASEVASSSLAPSGTPTTGGIGGSLLSERPNAPQAAQHESVATSRSNAWAARRMPSPKVR